MELSLSGRLAIVTGGTRGIGLAIARALADEGCALGLLARGEEGLARVAAELRGKGARVETAAGDVSDSASHDAAVGRLLDALGGVEVAVANAGGSEPGPALSASDEVFRSQYEWNTLSAIRLLRACAPRMQPGSSFVAISSISGLEAFGRPAYVAAKAALHGWAKCAAQEGAKRGIRVNCVAPGSILFPGGTWAKRLAEEPARYEPWVQSLPFGRLGTPEEVAAVVAFLASPRASWVSGATFVVDGCQTQSF